MTRRKGGTKDSSRGSGPRDYDVGYCKPPVEHQFKPGQSGNRDGRPRVRKTTSERMCDIRNKKVTVLDASGRSRKISKHELILENIVNKAISGDKKPVDVYLKVLKEFNIPLDPPQDIRIEVHYVNPKEYKASRNAEKKADGNHQRRRRKYD